MQPEFNLKPMGVGSILDHAFKIYRKNFSVIIIFSLLIGGVINLIISLLNSGASLFNPGILISDLSQGFSLDRLLEVFTPAGGDTSTLASVISFFSALIVSPFVNGGIVIIALGVCHGKEYRPAEALGETKSIWGKLIGTALAFAVCVIGFAIALVILLFIFGLLLRGAAVVVYVILLLAFVIVFVALGALYLPAAIQEECYGFKAVGRGMSLLFSKFWKSLGVLLLTYIFIMIIEAAIGALLAFLPTIVNVIGTTILSGVLSPVMIIVSTLLYLDIRMRNEGYGATDSPASQDGDI